MSGRTHGKNGQVWLNGTQLTTATTWNVSQARDYADISVYGDQGKQYASGIPGFTATFAGLLNVGGDEALAAAALGLIPILLYADPGDLVASGMGYVDVSSSADREDAVRVTGSIQGSGLWVWG